MTTRSSWTRTLTLVFVMLAGLAIAGSQIATFARAENKAAAGQWRRTARGWETTQGWFPASSRQMGIHPVTLGMLQILVSVGGLALFNWEEGANGQVARPCMFLVPQKSRRKNG